MDIDEAPEQELPSETERPVSKRVWLVMVAILSAVAGGIAQAVTERIIGGP